MRNFLVAGDGFEPPQCAYTSLGYEPSVLPITLPRDISSLGYVTFVRGFTKHNVLNKGHFVCYLLFINNDGLEPSTSNFTNLRSNQLI